MNDFNLITQLERLIALYNEGKITTQSGAYSPDFTSLIGDIKDTLSNVE